MLDSPGSTSRPWLFLFLFLFPVYMTWTFDHSLWNPDETRDAGIAREMYVTKDFTTPHLNGEPFLEKPPLYYWSCSAVYAVAGRITDGLTRLPAALYGFLGVLFTFLIGRRLYGENTGLLAAGILATSAQYFRMSHFALMDSSLAALIAGAFYFHVIGQTLLFAIFVTLAFYTKGFIAVALTGIVVLVDLALKRDIKRLALIIAVGAAVFGVLVTPWVYSLWKAGGMDHLKVFFIDNNWNRFASGEADHSAPFYFYMGSFPADFLPWTLAILGAAWSAFRKRFRTKNAFPTIWFVSMFTLLSIASGKRSIYLMPLFPAAALICAEWLDGFPNGFKIGRNATITLGLLLVLGSVFAVKRMDKDKSFLPVIDALNERRERADIVGFDLSEMERGVFPFYLESKIQNLKTPADLKMLLDNPPEKPIVILANRNKKKDIESVTAGRLKVTYEFRPDKKTRSYLIYEKM